MDDNVSTLGFPVYKFLDVDSTYRSRSNYTNPFDFVIPINFPARDGTAFTAVDPVVAATPYSGSMEAPGTLTTQAGSTATDVVLDAQEIDVDNFYINSFLEISGEFRQVVAYDGATKVAVVSPGFTGAPAGGTVYFTRKERPIFIGEVTADEAPTATTFTIDSTTAIENLFAGNFVRFTSGAHAGTSRLIQSFSASAKRVTLAAPLSAPPAVGDDVEINSFTRDNASILIKSQSSLDTNAYSTSSTYEMALQWLVVPVQTLRVGNGGTIGAYPYIYMIINNEGNKLADNIFYSNNPNSSSVVFKIPIDEWDDDKKFIVLSEARTSHVISFDPLRDIRVTFTLPSGDTIEMVEQDTSSPNEPHPFLQVSFLLSLRKIE